MKDCLDILLDFYANGPIKESDEQKVWIGNYIINLMKDLEQKIPDVNNRYIAVKNCLILLINLFFGIEYPDRFHVKGKSSNELTTNEKEQLLRMLKREMKKELLN